MDRGISPEERLLRLIRGKGKKEADEKSMSPAAISVEKKAHVNFDYLEAVNKFLKVKITPFLEFKTLNIFLTFLLIIFLLYFLIEILSPIKGRIQRISKTIKAQDQKVAEFKISQPKDYDYYNKQFIKRDIFDAPLFDTRTDGSGLSTSVKEAIKNLRLVGIILGEEPEVIIEDKSTKTTHFLHKGEILDKLEVKEILESKVILIYAGEEFELEL